jgi:general secretion pathway protein I
MTRPSPRDAGGFTLLEVLVALAILGLAVVASIQGFAQGLRLLKLSGDHQRAVQLADQKVRELQALQEEPESGEEAGFRWERTARLVETPAVEPETPARWHVWEIAVRVRWDAHRQVEVATLRTVPVEPVARAAPPRGAPR